MDNLTNRQLNFINFINLSKHNDKLIHSYLIECQNNDNDFNHVLSFVKMLLCNDKNIVFDKLDCGKCNVCKMIDELKYPDLYIVDVNLDESNIIKKEQILNLEKEFKNTSILDNKKIYIIKNADKMNLYASNTLLKFLEEPNDNIVGILLTDNKYKLLPTIVSRCQCLSLIDYYDLDLNNNYIYTFIKYMFNNNELFLNYDEIINNLFVDESDNNKLSRERVKTNITNVCMILEKYLYDGVSDLDFLNDFSINKINFVISSCYDALFNLNYNVNMKLWLDSLFSKIIGGLYD